ncbi:MAG: hypothetical protein MUE97_05955, partial [Phycisphaerales bacterium]|nr:hypothetical protein [Phycisphaerales bacterium]
MSRSSTSHVSTNAPRGGHAPLRRGTAALAATLALGAAGLTAPALAQWTPPTLAIPPADGGMFQWATVGALNNPAY